MARGNLFNLLPSGISSDTLDYILEVAASREGYGDVDTFAINDPDRYQEVIFKAAGCMPREVVSGSVAIDPIEVVSEDT